MPAYLLISAYKKTSLKLVLPTLTPLLRLGSIWLGYAHQPALTNLRSAAGKGEPSRTGD